MDICVQRDISPKCASGGNASLKYEEIDGNHSGANPIERKFLHHDVEKGHERRPRGSSQEHQETEDDRGAQQRHA
jgi:hypothetical protein